MQQEVFADCQAEVEFYGRFACHSMTCGGQLSVCAVAAEATGPVATAAVQGQLASWHWYYAISLLARRAAWLL